jgi:hypothetical protein
LTLSIELQAAKTFLVHLIRPKTVKINASLQFTRIARLPALKAAFIFDVIHVVTHHNTVTFVFTGVLTAHC